MRHILLTNDFPPKVGGIQSYLWELWRRLPPDDFVVYTAAYSGSQWWDAEQAFRVVRSRQPVLLPEPQLARRVRALAVEWGADAVVIDPALPLALVGPHLGLPYGVVLHGAEVTVPGRLPASRQLMARALSQSSLLIAAGGYPELEARRVMGQVGTAPAAVGAGGEPAGDGPELWPPAVRIPPGVDTERFRPLAHIDRVAARAHFGLPRSGPLVVSVSRLVPRKGMDTLIEAASILAERVPGLCVAIAGAGRDRHRLERLAASARVPVKFLGKVPDGDLPRFYGCADVFALCCRSRWWGLEQEGFGIVLVEAAACGVPCVTVDSGGAGEAVVDGETGLVAPTPRRTGALRPSDRSGLAAPVAAALATLLQAPEEAERMGAAGRRRAEEELSYDVLARRLEASLGGLLARPATGAPEQSAAPGAGARKVLAGRRWSEWRSR